MSWVTIIPIGLVCCAMLLVPGAMLSLGIGLRGLPAIASAPVFTVMMAAVVAIAFGQVGVPWTVWGLLVCSAVAMFALLLVRRLIQRRSKPVVDAGPAAVRANIIQVAGFAIGAALIGAQLIFVFGNPSNISQTFDGIFHLNAVRYILDTGNASSLTLTSMTNGNGAPYFYPAVWHGLTALLVQITGASIPVAANTFNLVTAAVAWPLGCMMLVQRVLGKKPWTIAFAGILASCFSSFPILLLDFGVLYPNFLSLCMLPVGLAAVAIFFNVGKAPVRASLARFGLAPMSALGIAVAHPNGAMTLLALSIPIALFAYWKRYVSRDRVLGRRREAKVAGASLLVGLILFVLVWKYVRPPADAAFWDRYHSPLGAAWEVATNSAMNRPIAWLVTVFMLMGIYVCVRNRTHLWLLGCFVLTTFFFIVIDGVSTSYLRSAITGVWYNDSYRVAAVLPLTALPLAAVGFDWLAAHAVLVVKRMSESDAAALKKVAGSNMAQTSSGICAVLILVLGMQIPTMTTTAKMASHSYAETLSAEVLSSDELALIDKIDSIVPPGQTIAVNPWTGASLAFALADRPTTSRHVLSSYTPNIDIINGALRDALTNPAVCPAVLATGVHYALDFGTKEVHGGHHDFPGLDDLEDSPAARQVASVGQAKLFEIIACR